MLVGEGSMAEEDDLIRLLYDSERSSNSGGRYDHDMQGTKRRPGSTDIKQEVEQLQAKAEVEDMTEGEDGFLCQDFLAAESDSDNVVPEHGSDLGEDNFGEGGELNDLGTDMEPDPDSQGESDEEASELESICKFGCKPCGLEFFTWDATKRHIRDKHSNVKEQKKKVKLKYEIDDFLVEEHYHKCVVCGEMVLQDVSILWSHMRNNHKMSAAEYRALLGEVVVQGEKILKPKTKKSEGDDEKTQRNPRGRYCCVVG